MTKDRAGQGMDEAFWRDKWRAERQGWRQPAANPMLVRNLSALGLLQGARLFVPLCGDTLDIGWLLAHGYRVAGAELVEDAVRRLFDGLGLTPAASAAGPLTRHSAEGVDIFVGDVFDLTPEALEPVDGTYDRAALVALPPGARRAYAEHVARITGFAPQLLVTFDYDQAEMEGPPFSVTAEEVRALYAESYDVSLLESAEVEGGLKGFCPATERAWRLGPPSP